jgi:hypothetical protein
MSEKSNEMMEDSFKLAGEIAKAIDDHGEVTPAVALAGLALVIATIQKCSSVSKEATVRLVSGTIDEFNKKSSGDVGFESDLERFKNISKEAEDND